MDERLEKLMSEIGKTHTINFVKGYKCEFRIDMFKPDHKVKFGEYRDVLDVHVTLLSGYVPVGYKEYVPINEKTIKLIKELGEHATFKRILEGRISLITCMYDYCYVDVTSIDFDN